MKKMKLQLLELSLNDLLTREQLKKIYGGSGSGGDIGSGPCYSECYGPWDYETNSKPILGEVEIPECNDTHRGDCRSTYPDASGASCYC